MICIMVVIVSAASTEINNDNDKFCITFIKIIELNFIFIKYLAREGRGERKRKIPIFSFCPYSLFKIAIIDNILIDS